MAEIWFKYAYIQRQYTITNVLETQLYIVFAALPSYRKARKKFWGRGCLYCQSIATRNAIRVTYCVSLPTKSM